MLCDVMYTLTGGMLVSLELRSSTRSASGSSRLQSPCVTSWSVLVEILWGVEFTFWRGRERVLVAVFLRCLILVPLFNLSQTLYYTHTNSSYTRLMYSTYTAAYKSYGQYYRE